MAEEEGDVAFAVCCVCGFVNARFSNLISVRAQTQKSHLKPRTSAPSNGSGAGGMTKNVLEDVIFWSLRAIFWLLGIFLALFSVVCLVG